MKRAIPVILGLVVAVVCIQLARWQLSRHAERASYNQLLAERQESSRVDAVTITGQPSDTLHFRRGVAVGVFDFSRDTVDIARSYRGMPGVHVLTPLVLEGGGEVWVNRGWAHSLDGRRVDLAALREPDSAGVDGFYVKRRPDERGVARFLLIRTVKPPGAPEVLTALEVPELDSGPHMSYAIQWFAFAVIGIVGGFLLARDRSSRETPTS